MTTIRDRIIERLSGVQGVLVLDGQHVLGVTVDAIAEIVEERTAVLASALRDGVAMLEESWGRTEDVCSRMDSDGGTTTRDDGSKSYGQPWDWLTTAKEVLR